MPGTQCGSLSNKKHFGTQVCLFLGSAEYRLNKSDFLPRIFSAEERHTLKNCAQTRVEAFILNLVCKRKVKSLT